MPQLEVATIVMKDAVNVLIGKAATGPDTGKWVIPSGYIAEGEEVIKTSARVTLEETGLEIVPKQVLFLSEVVNPGDHRVAVFCFGEYGSGDPTPGASLSEVKFVDPRTLGDYQKEGMSDLTADAFYKFSKILQAQAAAAPRSGSL
jgi:ADP-ribose pyrophosphatase YjhB (NUDIX family)